MRPGHVLRAVLLAVGAWGAAWLVNRSLQRVEGPSMQPSLWDGDLLVTAPPRWIGGLRRDDVVVAEVPAGRVVKRLAGLPGEPVLAVEGHRHAAGRWYRRQPRPRRPRRPRGPARAPVRSWIRRRRRSRRARGSGPRTWATPTATRATTRCG